jgi:hypothetical protein
MSILSIINYNYIHQNMHIHIYLYFDCIQNYINTLTPWNRFRFLGESQSYPSLIFLDSIASSDLHPSHIRVSESLCFSLCVSSYLLLVPSLPLPLLPCIAP